MSNQSAPKFSLSSRLPFYYGWLMVPIAVIAMAVTGVGQTYGISVFNPSLLDSLQISLTALTGAYMVGTLLAAIPQPYLGSLMDRFGIRPLMILMVVLLGAACMLFARVNSYLTLLLGFFLLRLLGQGGLSLLAGNIAPMWFRDRLGTVTGIISSGFSISMAVLPPFFLYLIQRSGWRTAYSQLGLLVWVIMLPLLLIVFRNNPEEVGQELDGQDLASAAFEVSGGDSQISYTPDRARRTSAYWILLVNSALWALVVTAVFFNLLSILDSSGVPENAAAATYTTYAAASLITQLLLGSAANRGPLQVLLSICMGLLATSVAVLALASNPWIAHLYAILIGISTGLIALVGGTMFARYYGRDHLGNLRGGVLTAQVAGSSLGPFITGLLFDLSGSFQTSLWIFVALLVPAAVISLKALPPQTGLESVSS